MGSINSNTDLFSPIDNNNASSALSDAVLSVEVLFPPSPERSLSSASTQIICTPSSPSIPGASGTPIGQGIDQVSFTCMSSILDSDNSSNDSFFGLDEKGIDEEEEPVYFQSSVEDLSISIKAMAMTSTNNAEDDNGNINSCCRSGGGTSKSLNSPTSSVNTTSTSGAATSSARTSTEQMPSEEIFASATDLDVPFLPPVAEYECPSETSEDNFISATSLDPGAEAVDANVVASESSLVSARNVGVVGVESELTFISTYNFEVLPSMSCPGNIETVSDPSPYDLLRAELIAAGVGQNDNEPDDNLSDSSNNSSDNDFEMAEIEQAGDDEPFENTSDRSNSNNNSDVDDYEMAGDGIEYYSYYQPGVGFNRDLMDLQIVEPPREEVLPPPPPLLEANSPDIVPSRAQDEVVEHVYNDPSPNDDLDDNEDNIYTHWQTDSSISSPPEVHVEEGMVAPEEPIEDLTPYTLKYYHFEPTDAIPQLLVFDPVLQFEEKKKPWGDYFETSLEVTNPFYAIVAFRIRVMPGSAELYLIDKPYGCIAPGDTITIHIKTTPFHPLSYEWIFDDTFCIQAAAVDIDGKYSPTKLVEFKEIREFWRSYKTDEFPRCEEYYINQIIPDEINFDELRTRINEATKTYTFIDWFLGTKEPKEELRKLEDQFLNILEEIDPNDLGIRDQLRIHRLRLEASAEQGRQARTYIIILIIVAMVIGIPSVHYFAVFVTKYLRPPPPIDAPVGWYDLFYYMRSLGRLIQSCSEDLSEMTRNGLTWIENMFGNFIRGFVPIAE